MVSSGWRSGQVRYYWFRTGARRNEGDRGLLGTALRSSWAVDGISVVSSGLSETTAQERTGVKLL